MEISGIIVSMLCLLICIPEILGNCTFDMIFTLNFSLLV